MKKHLFRIILTGLLCAGFVDLSASESTLMPAFKKVKVQSLKPQARAILEKGLTNENGRIRTAAIEIAVETGQKDLQPLIAKLAKDPVFPVRFSAVVGLGDMQSSNSEKLFRQSLNDPDVNVRIAAAYSLIKLKHPQYIDPLLAATKSTDQTVRANATLLLGKLGDRDQIPVLYEVLRADDSADKVRIQAVESIARLGDEKMYRSKLWALLISKFADDRVMGIRGMGALNTAESRDAITTMLKDDVVEVRLAAAEQLSRLGDTGGKEEVIKYFQGQPDLNKPDVANSMALIAIGHLKSDRLNAQLPQALSSEHPYIQLLAAQSVLIQTK